MQKQLTKVGNSKALIIDRPILDLLGIDEETDLELSTDGENLIIHPINPNEPHVSGRLQEALDEYREKYSELFSKLRRNSD